MTNIPSKGLPDLEKAIGKIDVHDHMCLIYETQEEQFSAVIPFVRIGLERGEKCLYVVDDNTATMVINGMKAADIDVESAVETGRLAIVSKQESYLRQGFFDPDWMINFLKCATDETITGGFSALRITGEMTWVLDGDPGFERLMEYEAKLNYFFPENKALAICQYNRNRFSPAIIKNVIDTHPLIIFKGMVCKNFYYIPPDNFLSNEQPDKEIERLLANIKNREKVEVELQQYQEHLEYRTAQLVEANKELENIAYSIAHDLRSPLRSINGFSQLLLDEYQDKVGEQGKNYLHRVRSASQYMAQLLDDMLKLSRISRGEINLKPINLSEMALDIADHLHNIQPERQVEFIVQVGVKVMGDSQLLRIVMEELFDNAWKFTSKHPTARIEFGTQQQKEILVYFIRDDGAGFEMEYSQKLFGAFQRLHTTTEFPGTGIGLATVQRVIHRHGGKVWAEGVVENLPAGKAGGATFYFTLP